MKSTSKDSHIILLLAVGLLSWMIPGTGYLLIKENKRAAIIFLTIIMTFALGLYIGSFGVINPVNAKPWYMAQLMVSPTVAFLGHFSTVNNLLIYGRANDYGQIYTGIAGLLNLLGIINAVYMAHVKTIGEEK